MAYDTNWAAFGPNSLIREKRKKKKKRWVENQRIGYKKKKKKISCYMTLITTRARH